MKLFSYLQEKHGISRREYMQMLKEEAVYVWWDLVKSIWADASVGSILEIRSKGKILLSESIHELRKKERVIVLFNKPKWYAVSKEDKHNKTIYELLPKSRQKDFYYIGRLDKESHGLLLLTNDPVLVDLYEKPENKIDKIYEVQIDKPMRSNHIQQAKRGIPVDEQGNLVTATSKKSDTPPMWVEILKALHITYKSFKEKHFLTITLNEWKKRHIRRLLKALWYTVKDLMRVKVGKYQLGSIKPGKYMLQRYKDILDPQNKKERKKTTKKTH